MAQETLKKINEIKYIMKKKSSKGYMGSRRPHIVGIFAEENDFWWLDAVLTSHYFSRIIEKIRLIDTSDHKTLQTILSCTFYIFISSGYNQKTFPTIRQRLGLLFEWENLIIIIDNLEDSSEAEKKKILQENPDCVQREENIFLFSKRERGTNYLINLLNDGPSGSVRLKKKELISIYATTTRNHNQQQRRKTDFGTSTESIDSIYGTSSRNQSQQQRRKTGHGTSAGVACEHFFQRSVINGHRVGIFTRSTDRDYSWLVEMLRSKDFRPHISDVQSFHIFKDTVSEIIQKVSKCTFGILYQTQKTEMNMVTTIKYDLETLYSRLGKQNVALLIDDLEDSGDGERSHILDTHRGAAQRIDNLLLVSYQDKMEKKSLEMVKAELEKQLQGSDLIKHEPKAEMPPTMFPASGIGHESLSSQRQEIKCHQVGIFSRSADRDYGWLVEKIRSEEFSSHVGNVKGCVIHNDQKFQDFVDAISQCTFGILYHSKNRGTVNVTNVTDSLYDEELKTLHSILGKENVLVIIDDLEDSSDEQKADLLRKQHSIAEQAVDLLLVSHSDKTDLRLLRKKTDQLRSLLRGADGSIGNQLETSQNEKQRGAVSSPSLGQSLFPPCISPEERPSFFMGRRTPTSSRSTIGIFSRSEESDYFWLKTLLTSEDFGQRDVLCYNMSINNNKALREAAFKSKFGILYHSVKNGKIRLTDVKKSLYHEELEQLSAKLGKRRIIVVIDDLDDIGDRLKQKILEEQPSLGRLVAEIFLFTISEKKMIDQYKHGRNMDKSTMGKISIMKKILS